METATRKQLEHPNLLAGQVSPRFTDWLVAERYAEGTRAGWTNKRLAWHCGVTERTIERWRRADRAEAARDTG